MKQYAIVINKIGGEFYPDSTRDNLDEIKKKVDYLNNYRKDHNISERTYVIETLSKDRLAQHTEEWTKWVASID